jgi:hypothetical protein
MLCVPAVIVLPTDSHPMNVRTCYECTNPFVARSAVIQWFHCRVRRAKNTVATPAFDIAFNSFRNLFQSSITQKRDAPPTLHSSILVRQKSADDRLLSHIVRDLTSCTGNLNPISSGNFSIIYTVICCPL